MNPVRVIRVVAGLTQAELARRSGTSQSAVAAYESASKSPTWRTVLGLAAGAGLECRAWAGTPLTREERRSLALHLAMAEALQADPEAVLARARANVARMRAASPADPPLLGDWETILDRSLPRIVSLMLDPGEYGCELRQLTPFAGVLDTRQRAAVYRAFRHAEAA